MSDYLSLVVGVICAGVGGELFVRGAVGLAFWARISPGIVGATVAAFATSSPELSVSVTAAASGYPQIGLGDALGSNVVNVALILGLALMISGIQCPQASIKRDFPVAIAVPVITGLLLLDGEISRLDGLCMISGFFIWLSLVLKEARIQRKNSDGSAGNPNLGNILMTCGAGLAILFMAGRLIVSGAKGIAVSYGVPEFIIGATIVAVGTSVPELATTLIAKLRGHDEVGLGTIIGSNIFNGLFIVSVAAIIHPIVISWNQAVVALVFGLAAIAFTHPIENGYIEQRRGVFLLMLYLVYLAFLIRRNMV
jgi:cation:H+ antiporter